MIQQLSVKGRIENTQILEEVGLETEEISEKRLFVKLLKQNYLGNFKFRTISGNPRQFNYRDESAGVCISAQCK